MLHDIFTAFCVFVDDWASSSGGACALHGLTFSTLTRLTCLWAENDDFVLSVIADRTDTIISISSELYIDQSALFTSLLPLVHSVVNCAEETELTQRFVNALYGPYGLFSSLVRFLTSVLAKPCFESNELLIVSLEVCKSLTRSRFEDVLVLSKGEGKAAIKDIYGATHDELKSLSKELERVLAKNEDELSSHVGVCLELMHSVEAILVEL